MFATVMNARGKVARYFDRRQRRRLFDRAMRRFDWSLPGVEWPADLLNDLVEGWGNTWSAQEEYIRAFLNAAQQARGPILECGSGLSTLLLGAVAKHTGNRVYSLEHDPVWLDRIKQSLARHSIDTVTVCLSEIVSYGSYSWYAPPLDQMPTDFDLVICDGPPGSTAGGRYGFLPVMQSRCHSGCQVLLDDAIRPSERTVLERWAQELGTTYTIEGDAKPFARLMIP